MPTAQTWLGPPISETYATPASTGRRSKGDVVRVHWYEGDQAFGAAGAADRRRRRSPRRRQLLGVTETEPIDFFIYADQDQFYDALGPATRENVGGEAHADIRTMFALITPGEIDDRWVEVVVPHELTHLVFDTATDNPYHEPPHWLNEGLAVYLSEGYDVERPEPRRGRGERTGRSCRSRAWSAPSRRPATGSSWPTPRASSAVD